MRAESGDATVPRWRRERAVRVFVSSTFTDMQCERDVLARRTFPEVRARCELRGVTLAEVDLRWGITDEEAERGLVLSTCLAEIDHCRPFFIGIIGERYGTEFAPSPADRRAYPWLCEGERHSILELEFCHAVSAAPRPGDHAVFLIKQPGRRDDPRLVRLIEALAGRVELRGYRNLEELHEIVDAQLTAVIDRAFGPLDASADRARAAQDAYCAVRAGGIPRARLVRALDRQLAGSGPPLIVAGEAGTGKTTLLIDWLETLRARGDRGRWWWRRPAAAAPAIVFHASAATPGAPTWRDALRYLWRQLAPFAGWPADPPDDGLGDAPDAAEPLRERFAELVAQFPVGQRAVVVIDSADQLVGGAALEWLPRAVAPSIRLVVSVLPPAARLLRDRGWRRVDLPPLARAERRIAVTAYLGRFRRRLPAKHTARIVNAPGAGHPLYLRLLLNEARVFGSHERLPEHLAYLAQHASVRALFGAILDRLEHDHTATPALVAKALGLLAASRYGVAEHELADLLSAGRHPAPWASWATLRLALGDAVILEAGRVQLSDAQLADVVRARYLGGSAGGAAHRVLAIYFQQDHMPLARRVVEVPEQLVAIGDWAALRALLVDPAALAAAWRSRADLVVAWWALVERHGPGSIREAYRGWAADPGVATDAAWAAGSLLAHAGHAALAIPIWERLLTRRDVAEKPRAVAGILGNLASALRGAGRYADAKHVFHCQEQCCRAANDLRGLQACLGNQGLLAADAGDLVAADALHAQEAQLCRELRMPGALGRALIHRARIRLLRSRADTAGRRARIAEAFEYLDDGERSCRHVADRRGLLVAAGVRAAVLRERGQRKAALRILHDQANGFRALGDHHGFALALCEQAATAMELLDFDAALRDVRGLAQLASDRSDPRPLAWSLYLEAVLMVNMGQLDRARLVAREAMALCSTYGWDELHSRVARVLGQLGDGIA